MSENLPWSVKNKNILCQGNTGAKLRAAAAWFLLLGLAGLVRFYGIDFGLMPAQSGFTALPITRFDEELIWAVAARFYSGDLNPHFFIYPTFFSYLTAGVYFVYFLIKTVFISPQPLILLKQNLAMNPSELILIARGTAALLGTLTIPLIYKIADSLWGRKTAVLGALFLAFSYLHVRDSHFAVADVPMTFMLCLAFLGIVKVYRFGRWKDYIGSGIGIGLAISTKWGAGGLIISLLTAHFLREEKRDQFPKLIASLGLVLFGFVCGTPYAVLSPNEFWRDVSSEMAIRSYPDWHGVRTSIGWIHHLRFTLWHGVGWPIVLSAFLGIFVVFKKNWKNALLTTSFLLPYYILAGKQYLVFARYMVPAVPFIGLLAACGWVWISEKLPLLKTSAVRYALGVLLLGPSIWNIYTVNNLLRQTDSRILAGDWINENIRKDQRIGLLMSASEFPAIFIKNDRWNSMMKKRFDWPPDFLGKEIPEEEFFKADIISTYHYWKVKKTEEFSSLDFIIIPESHDAQFDYSDKILADIRKHWDWVNSFKGLGRDARMKFDGQDRFYVPFSGARHAERPGPNMHLFKRREVK